VTPFNDISDANPQETFDYVVGELNRFDLAFLDILQGTGGAPLNQPDYEKLCVGEEKGYTDYPFLPA
jgi:hypothetical protein